MNFRCDSVYVGILPTFHTIFTCHFDQSNEHTKYCYDFTLIFLVKLEKGLFKKQIDTLRMPQFRSGTVLKKNIENCCLGTRALPL